MSKNRVFAIFSVTSSILVLSLAGYFIGNSIDTRYGYQSKYAIILTLSGLFIGVFELFYFLFKSK